MNEEENQEVSIDDAKQAIINIEENTSENTEILNEIESDLTDLNQHITNIDEYLVINNNEQRKEQTTKKENEETEQKEEEQITENQSEESEEITLTNIYSEIQTVNENLTLTNNILSGNIIFLGIIVGVVLGKILWDRLRK